MHLIGITGKAGAGKDTVADSLVSRHGFTKISWADTLKAGLAAMGFPEPANREDKEKLIPGFDFTWREAAQKLGTEWGRALDPDIWLKTTAKRMRRASDRFVIADVRFDNEAEMVRSKGGVMLFLHGRQADLGENSGHASEAGVTFKPETDHLIDNGLDFDFTQQQVEFVLYNYLKDQRT